MAKIRIEKNRQLTLPDEIIEQAHLQCGDLLEATYFNGAITLYPTRKSKADVPRKTLMEYAGIGKGVWGKTVEEIDANLAEDRASWER